MTRLFAVVSTANNLVTYLLLRLEVRLETAMHGRKVGCAFGFGSGPVKANGHEQNGSRHTGESHQLEAQAAKERHQRNPFRLSSHRA